MAGFPCQPFSKSGAQRGMDETRGTLYWNILRIIQGRKPKVVVLENVRNIAGPRHMHEWQVIIETLRDEGYRVSETPGRVLSHLLPPRAVVVRRSASECSSPRLTTPRGSETDFPSIRPYRRLTSWTVGNQRRSGTSRTSSTTRTTSPAAT